MQLLAEAGYPNGFTFTLNVEDNRRDIAEAYAFMLSEVGITANVVPWGDYNAMVAPWRRGELDAMMSDWGDSTMDPTGIFIPKLRSNDRGNYGGYSNPVVDALIELAESTTDPEDRAEAYQKARSLVYEDAPMVFEYITQELYAQNKRVSGWDPIPDSRINLQRQRKLTAGGRWLRAARLPPGTRGGFSWRRPVRGASVGFSFRGEVIGGERRSNCSSGCCS